MIDFDTRLSLILGRLGATKVDLSDEKRAQAMIAEALTGLVPFTREHRLSAADVPDFFADGIVVEVKLKKNTRKMQVYRQLERYAAHEAVRALVLVTNLAMGLPRAINGKPAYYISLGRAWL